MVFSSEVAAKAKKGCKTAGAIIIGCFTWGV